MNARARSLPLVAALLVVTLFAFAGCGSSGPSQADLAAQDRRMLAADRQEAAHARVVAVARRLKLQRQSARLEMSRAKRRRLRGVGRRTVLQSVGFPSAELCGPIRGGGPVSRRERNRRRKQTLRYLNLRC